MLFKDYMDEGVSVPAMKRFLSFKLSSSSTFEHFPFLEYAVPHWGDHAKECAHQVIEDMATRLLRDSARVNSLAKMRTTGLHIAAKLGLKNLCLALLRRGVPIDCADQEGETSLHVAVAHDRTETTLMLLKSGAYLDAPNKRQVTSLFWQLGLETSR